MNITSSYQSMFRIPELKRRILEEMVPDLEATVETMTALAGEIREEVCVGRHSTDVEFKELRVNFRCNLSREE